MASRLATNDAELSIRQYRIRIDGHHLEDPSLPVRQEAVVLFRSEYNGAQVRHLDRQ